MAIGEEGALLDKLRRLVLAEGKLVSYKSACSYLNVGCQESKVLLQKLVDSAPAELESTYMICGEQKEGSHMCFKVVPKKEVEAIKGSIGKVTMEHIYSVWRKKKSGEEDQLLTDKEVFSQRHYQGDLDTMQSTWLDRKNIMTDQPLLDHRWSQIGANGHTRTKPRRPANLCSPKKKKTPPPAKFDPFAKKPAPKKMEEDEKEPLAASKKRKLDSLKGAPPKKKAKFGIAAMFGKAAKKQSTDAAKKPPAQPEKKKKGGLFGFFGKASKPANPFDSLKKEKAPNFGKSKPKKSSKKKATKATKQKKKAAPKKTSKPKKPLKAKKEATPPPDPKDEMDNLFADEDESEPEEEKMRMMRNEEDEEDEEVESEEEAVNIVRSKKSKKRKRDAAFRDSDSENEGGEDSPVKALTKKEKRELAKQEADKVKKAREAAHQEKLLKRKAAFWGAATGKAAAKPKKSKKMKTITYIDEDTGMLVTEEVEASDSEGTQPGGGKSQTA